MIEWNNTLKHIPSAVRIIVKLKKYVILFLASFYFPMPLFYYFFDSLKSCYYLKYMSGKLPSSFWSTNSAMENGFLKMGLEVWRLVRII